MKQSVFQKIFQGSLWFAVGLVLENHGMAGERSPNFIVILCDNLGFGDTQPFGSTLHRTPYLNRMAKEGLKLTSFYATAGVCTPSRASLMTGCYAQRIGLHTNPRDGLVLRPVSPYGLNPHEETIAEILKTKGYATAILGKWHLGDQPEFLPTRQGFEYYLGIPYSDDMTQRQWKNDGSQWPPLPLMENEKVISAPCDRNGLTELYTEKALSWIEENRDRPFFLYLPHAMPGSTKQPFSSDRFRGKSRNGPWGDAIEELDWSVGRILQQLRDLQIHRNTMVIWTSDNGAPLASDPAELSRGSNLPLHGRGYSTSEGAFRVPAIAWQPGKIAPGTECNELSSMMDLLPTFAYLSNANLPKNKIDGQNISPLLYGAPHAKSPHKAFYFYQQDQLQAVRSGPWKLFLPVQPSGRHPHFSRDENPKPMLFHLENDIACKENVAKAHPETVKRLTKLADDARQELGDRNNRGSGQRPVGKISGQALPLLPSG